VGVLYHFDLRFVTRHTPFLLSPESCADCLSRLLGRGLKIKYSFDELTVEMVQYHISGERTYFRLVRTWIGAGHVLGWHSALAVHALR
jgi:hypothetical protein